ncbi:MAG: beta-ketoacyl-ACP synthase II [Ruminococcus sp.]|nr:beta-ketoacyl-ACP synthase II [Ruminococcus sp.]
MRRVVVTGLGAVTPVGNDVPTIWENLINGVCGIDFIPEERFSTEGLKVKIAGLVKNFEPTKYFEKKEIRKNDLCTQFAVAAATEAVEDSGIIGNIEAEKLGVYVGSGIGGLKSFYDNSVNMEKFGAKKVSPFFIPMMISNMPSGTIAIKFNAKGPCVPIVTACATGSHAIGEAFHAIKNGYCDAIIAGGSEAAASPLAIAGFQNMKALTTKNEPESSSIPFDKNRDGFVIGEGGACVILEEYEHAKARGAKIYAEISGYGNTCDANHITAPDSTAQVPANAIKAAMQEAGVTGDEEWYWNAHGTSTHLNDLTETKAIKLALGENAYRVNVSSTKSMTGHLFGATGAFEAIVSVLALNKGIIPPTINLNEPDEECDLNYTPNKAVKRDVNVAASTNLGFGGHNACLIFRKYQEEQ